MANVTPLKFHNNPLKLDLLPDKVVRVEFRGAVPSGPWPNGITTPPVNEATIEILVTFNNGDTKPFHLDNPVPVVPGETLVVRGCPQAST